MFLKLICLSSILIYNVAIATDLSVISRASIYKLRFDETQVWLEGPQMKLEMIKNDCNSGILQKFAARMRNLKKLGPLKVNEESTTFKFVLDGKDYFESYRSKRGVLLLKLPEEIQRMKLEEKYLCKK